MEVLFDIGAHAILDGYYREAVSSFTSSLERFYEFSIRSLIERTGVPEEVTLNCWKKISKQSERQLGAFIFLWVNYFKSAPELLSNSQITFRNEVVHKGKIPNREEATKYGNAVLSVIRPKLESLKENFSEEISKVTFYHLRGDKSKNVTEKQVSTMCVPTIVSLSNGEPGHDKKSLEESLVSLEEQRLRMGGVKV